MKRKDRDPLFNTDAKKHHGTTVYALWIDYPNPYMDSDVYALGDHNILMNMMPTIPGYPNFEAIIEPTSISGCLTSSELSDCVQSILQYGGQLLPLEYNKLYPEGICNMVIYTKK